jgi:hypothetical protein
MKLRHFENAYFTYFKHLEHILGKNAYYTKNNVTFYLPRPFHSKFKNFKIYSAFTFVLDQSGLWKFGELYGKTVAE